MRRFGPLNLTALALGLAFLYLPIAILVDQFVQRLAPRHGVGRLRRCAGIARSPTMPRCSTPPGCRSASRFSPRRAATVLGTLAALALTRGGRFRGRCCSPA